MTSRRSIAWGAALGSMLIGGGMLLTGRGEAARPLLLGAQGVIAMLAASLAWERLREETNARGLWISVLLGSGGLAIADVIATAWRLGWVAPERLLGEAGWAAFRVGPAGFLLIALWFWPRRVQRRGEQYLGALDGLIIASAGFILLGWYSLSAFMHDPAIPLDRRVYQSIAAVLGFGAVGLFVFQQRRLLPSTKRRFAAYRQAVLWYGMLTLADPLLYPLGFSVPLPWFNLFGVATMLLVFRVCDAPLEPLPAQSSDDDRRGEQARSIVVAAVVVVAVWSVWRGDVPDPLLVATGALLVGALLARERLVARELRELSRSLEHQVRERTRELEESQEELVQAQRLEAVGKMAGGVAHDFRNILMGVRAIVELEREELPNDHALRESLGQVLEAVDRGADLTRDLITFARQEPSSGQSVADLDTLVRDTTPVWRRQIPDEITIEHRLGVAGVSASISTKAASRILTNLVLNARDAMPHGGCITISTERTEVDDAPAIHAVDAHAGTFVRVTVADTGIGMPPEVASRVFEPYFTTKGEGKGTGLGLSTVYGLVRQVDGFVHMQTAPGSGTRFEVYLPVAR